MGRNWPRIGQKDSFAAPQQDLRMGANAPELAEKDFREVCDLIYQISGIYLRDGKEPLVKSRLMKRLRALGIRSYREYLSHVKGEGGAQELEWMVDVLTTNKTSFFREAQHFHFLAEKVFPRLQHRKLRFWSSACSSGEEPYTLAMFLREKLPNVDHRDVKVLATDISFRVLERAVRGVYPEDSLGEIPVAWRSKYFSPTGENGMQSLYKVKANIRSMIHYARLNLMGSWPMKGPFQIIFCRNVMIYFDRNTQQNLVRRFWSILEEGGYLFVGHAEGLSSISHKFRYVRPAVYQK